MENTQTNETTTVNVVPHKTTGQKITASKNGKGFGYIQVQSTTTSIGDGGWLRTKKRSALIKGLMEDLKTHVLPLINDGKLPGRIVISEFTESELQSPENAKFRARLGKKEVYEENMLRAIKKTDNTDDAVALTKGGDYIVRFQDYVTPDNKSEDILVAHDNLDEVAKYNEEKKSATATFGA